MYVLYYVRAMGMSVSSVIDRADELRVISCDFSSLSVEFRCVRARRFVCVYASTKIVNNILFATFVFINFI